MVQPAFVQAYNPKPTCRDTAAQDRVECTDLLQDVHSRAENGGMVIVVSVLVPCGIGDKRRGAWAKDLR